MDPAAVENSGASVHKTPEAHARLKRRYRAETRLKIAGIMAIAFAASALLALLYSVVGKAMGALTETYITLPVTISKDVVDPEGTGDPKVIRKGNFTKLVRNSLLEAAPGVKGRKQKRALYGLLSDAAATELREKVMADPSLVGTTIPVRMLASDDVDLYVKGYDGKINDLGHPGTATPIGTEGDVKVVVESNAFAGILSIVKEDLAAQAQLRRREAANEQRGVDVFTRRLGALAADAEPTLRKKYEDGIARYTANRDRLIKQAQDLETRSTSPGNTESMTSTLPTYFVRLNGGIIKVDTVSTDEITGRTVVPLTSEAPAPSSEWSLMQISKSAAGRRVTDDQVVWIQLLKERGAVQTVFNTRFFSSSDSREAEIAGVWGSIVGSFWTMVVTFLLSFPVGVLAAIYLEEFAPKNAVTDFIEVNINNLAAVPSIVFGLLGLAVFIGFFGVPRSAALAGGIVLALMTLPTIIIASRAAIKAVPPSIKEAALGVGASKVQAVFHHVLPPAMPGILTGTIIGMAQALGETAPLLMIGMVAFIKDVPSDVLEPASVLPVQIFRWADFPERAFEMRTALAILVLLVFLVLMNALAVLLRRRFERRW